PRSPRAWALCPTPTLWRVWLPNSIQTPLFNKALSMLNTAFEALKKFDWGSDLAALNPIEDAAIAAHDKPEVGKELESRLVAALQSELSLDAQEYVCRKLAMVGTAAAVPSLSVLLVKKEIWN